MAPPTLTVPRYGVLKLAFFALCLARVVLLCHWLSLWHYIIVVVLDQAFSYVIVKIYDVERGSA